jgi:hypothetical protein
VGVGLAGVSGSEYEDLPHEQGQTLLVKIPEGGDGVLA